MGERWRRRDPRTVVVVGVVFMLLSTASIAWRWSEGEPATAELALFVGGLIVLVFGLSLTFRPRT